VSGLRIAVLGATGYLGAPLTAALAAAPGVELVLAVGRRELSRGGGVAPGVVVASCDAVTGPVEALLARHRIEVVVHLVFSSQPTRDEAAAFAVDVAATGRTLLAAARAGVRRAVLVSSVGVYGPRVGGEPVGEAAPARPNSFQFSWHKGLQELAAHSTATTTGLELAIARPCTVVGGRGRNFLLELLGRPVVPLPAGGGSEWQFLHADDFTGGVLRLLESGATGPYNLVPADTVSIREAVRLLGGHPLPAPRSLLSGVAHASWALRVGGAVPAAALAFLDRPPVASGDRAARELGFVPALGSRAALLAAGVAAPRPGPLQVAPDGGS
jgi:UDP-glucose 4-epimerase